MVIRYHMQCPTRLSSYCEIYVCMIFRSEYLHLDQGSADVLGIGYHLEIKADCPRIERQVPNFCKNLTMNQ